MYANRFKKNSPAATNRNRGIQVALLRDCPNIPRSCANDRIVGNFFRSIVCQPCLTACIIFTSA